MNPSSSPPVLYLGDDDDDDNEQDQYFETNRSLHPKASSSNDMNLPRKKRKLANANVRVNPSVVNWSKRQRNDHYQQQSSQNYLDSDLDSEPILLDPHDYIIEEPDTQSYRSFDWTIQSQPPPSPLLSTKISSNPIQTIPRVSTSNVNNTLKRPIDKPNPISVANSNDRFIQPQRKSTSMPPPRPSLALLSLPLPKPTSSLSRANTQRGRPTKNSRIPTIQSTLPPSPVRPRPEQQVFAQKQQTSRPPPPPPPPPPPSSTATTVTTSSLNNSPSELRRQVLNGTGIFSAFHDSKYYRCNICKFKSVTSSTLLQHLFTHMFFCDQCSFYTYSYYNLSQHMFEKHHLNLIEEIIEPLNPKAFDLLYVTRCTDGTFALCMDSSSSSSSSTTTTKVTNNDQRLIISSATPTDQHQNQSSKKKTLKQKDSVTEEDNDIVVLTEKRENNPRLLGHSKRKEKANQTYVLMKHRRCYSMKKTRCLHSLTLEYNICREHTIRHMSQTQDIVKRRRFSTKFHNTRLIDEVAHCLKTIVNNIVASEDNSDPSSPICTLPNEILTPILSIDNLNTLTNLLKLNNKYEQCREQNQLYEDEYSLRRNREHNFILSSPESNQTEQSIISSLHSSMTNGDSIFTQSKAEKLSTTYDNTHRYLKGNSNQQPQLNPKVPKKISTIPVLPKQVPLRPVISKPLRPLSNPLVDRNNNSVTSSPSKPPTTTTTPNVIILD